ncbi:uncharacterized protein LOC122796436 isoform X2 [Protopterus annectens]|uniref:uncharacterized protein LOC122796436 isoform X2 n=1 Tax=Protopterus annectens TaxID=7888 RepID=UPI001CFAB4A8|nr:uncharacterized protein LOC122796436 isoform X2 [Protopterus annectens]
MEKQGTLAKLGKLFHKNKTSQKVDESDIPKDQRKRQSLPSDLDSPPPSTESRRKPFSSFRQKKRSTESLTDSHPETSSGQTPAVNICLGISEDKTDHETEVFLEDIKEPESLQNTIKKSSSKKRKSKSKKSRSNVTDSAKEEGRKKSTFSLSLLSRRKNGKGTSAVPSGQNSFDGVDAPAFTSKYETSVNVSEKELVKERTETLGVLTSAKQDSKGGKKSAAGAKFVLATEVPHVPKQKTSSFIKPSESLSGRLRVSQRSTSETGTGSFASLVGTKEVTPSFSSSKQSSYLKIHCGSREALNSTNGTGGDATIELVGAGEPHTAISETKAVEKSKNVAVSVQHNAQGSIHQTRPDSSLTNCKQHRTEKNIKQQIDKPVTENTAGSQAGSKQHSKKVIQVFLEEIRVVQEDGAETLSESSISEVVSPVNKSVSGQQVSNEILFPEHPGSPVESDSCHVDSPDVSVLEIRKDTPLTKLRSGSVTQSDQVTDHHGICEDGNVTVNTHNQISGTGFLQGSLHGSSGKVEKTVELQLNSSPKTKALNIYVRETAESVDPAESFYIVGEEYTELDEMDTSSTPGRNKRNARRKRSLKSSPQSGGEKTDNKTSSESLNDITSAVVTSKEIVAGSGEVSPTVLLSETQIQASVKQAGEESDFKALPRADSQKSKQQLLNLTQIKKRHELDRAQKPALLSPTSPHSPEKKVPRSPSAQSVSDRRGSKSAYFVSTTQDISGKETVVRPSCIPRLTSPTYDASFEKEQQEKSAVPSKSQPFHQRKRPVTAGEKAVFHTEVNRNRELGGYGNRVSIVRSETSGAPIHTVTAKLNIPAKPRNQDGEDSKQVILSEDGPDLNIKPIGKVADRISLFEQKNTSHKKIEICATKNISVPQTTYVGRVTLQMNKQVKENMHSEADKMGNQNTTPTSLEFDIQPQAASADSHVPEAERADKPEMKDNGIKNSGSIQGDGVSLTLPLQESSSDVKQIVSELPEKREEESMSVDGRCPTDSIEVLSSAVIANEVLHNENLDGRTDLTEKTVILANAKKPDDTGQGMLPHLVASETGGGLLHIVKSAEITSVREMGKVTTPSGSSVCEMQDRETTVEHLEKSSTQQSEFVHVPSAGLYSSEMQPVEQNMQGPENIKIKTLVSNESTSVENPSPFQSSAQNMSKESDATTSLQLVHGSIDSFQTVVKETPSVLQNTENIKSPQVTFVLTLNEEVPNIQVGESKLFTTTQSIHSITEVAQKEDKVAVSVLPVVEQNTIPEHNLSAGISQGTETATVKAHTNNLDATSTGDVHTVKEGSQSLQHNIISSVNDDRPDFQEIKINRSHPDFSEEIKAVTDQQTVLAPSLKHDPVTSESFQTGLPTEVPFVQSDDGAHTAAGSAAFSTLLNSKDVTGHNQSALVTSLDENPPITLVQALTAEHGPCDPVKMAANKTMSSGLQNTEIHVLTVSSNSPSSQTVETKLVSAVEIVQSLAESTPSVANEVVQPEFKNTEVEKDQQSGQFQFGNHNVSSQAAEVKLVGSAEQVNNPPELQQIASNEGLPLDIKNVGEVKDHTNLVITSVKQDVRSLQEVETEQPAAVHADNSCDVPQIATKDIVSSGLQSFVDQIPSNKDTDSRLPLEEKLSAGLVVESPDATLNAVKNVSSVNVTNTDKKLELHQNVLGPSLKQDAPSFREVGLKSPSEKPLVDSLPHTKQNEDISTSLTIEQNLSKSGMNNIVVGTELQNKKSKDQAEDAFISSVQQDALISQEDKMKPSLKTGQSNVSSELAAQPAMSQLAIAQSIPSNQVFKKETTSTGAQFQSLTSTQTTKKVALESAKNLTEKDSITKLTIHGKVNEQLKTDVLSPKPVVQQNVASSTSTVKLPNLPGPITASPSKGQGGQLNVSSSSEDGSSDASDIERFAEMIRKLESPINLSQIRVRGPKTHVPPPPFAMPPIQEDRFEKVFDPSSFTFGLGKSLSTDSSPSLLFKKQGIPDAKPKLKTRRTPAQSILFKSVQGLNTGADTVEAEADSNETDNDGPSDFAVKRSRLEQSAIYKNFKLPSSTLSSLTFSTRNQSDSVSESTSSVSPVSPNEPGLTSTPKTPSSLENGIDSPSVFTPDVSKAADFKFPLPSFPELKLPSYLEKYLKPADETEQKHSEAEFQHSIQGVLSPLENISRLQAPGSKNGGTEFMGSPTSSLLESNFPFFDASAAIVQIPEIVPHEIINPRPGKMVIYSQPGFGEEIIEAFHDMDDCTSWKLSPVISVKVVRGCWIIYEKPNFEGQSIPLEEGEVELVNMWGDDIHGESHEENKAGPEVSAAEKSDVSPVKSAVIGSIRHVVKDYRICQIDLFSEPDGLGNVVTFFDDAEETQQYGVPLKTQSIKVYSGVWLVYELAHFQGMHSILEAGEYSNPEAWGMQEPYIGSLRPLKMGMRKVELPGEPKVILYEKPFFKGKFMTLAGDVLSINKETVQENENFYPCQTLPFASIGSIKVLGGLWVGYELPGFEGRQYVLEEGEYREWIEWGGINPQLQSLQPIITDFSSPHMVMHSEPNLGAAELSIDVMEIVPSLEEVNYGNNTRSINVLGGVWVAFENPDFTGAQYVLLKGLYSHFEDWGARNSKISSVQPFVVDNSVPKEKYKLTTNSCPPLPGVSDLPKPPRPNLFHVWGQ